MSHRDPASARPGAARARRAALFVMAHPDDECCLSIRMERERAAGHEVHCAYLTRGARPGKFSEPVRRREGLDALTSVGVDPARVHWIGSAVGIDGEDLPAHLPEALAALEAAMAGVPVRRLYCLSFEGGHPDHDAAALLTAAFARRRGRRVRAWQLPFYSGHGTRWRFFRLHRPVSRQARVLVARVPRREAFRHATLFLHHRSQWRTWLGLVPGHLLQRLVLRREVMQALDPALLRARPHPGPLLYERMLAIPWERFEDRVAAFRRAHLDEAPAALARSADQ